MIATLKRAPAGRTQDHSNAESNANVESIFSECLDDAQLTEVSGGHYVREYVEDVEAY